MAYAVGSGSTAFDQLRDGLAADAGLRGELEAAMQLNVDRVNPTDPGNRFIVGGAVEWLIAAAAWSLKILTVPGGHSTRGFDLLALQDAARGLWSVKAQTAAKPAAFRITNGLGGAGAGFQDATVFVSPHLPGLTLIHPGVHLEAAATAKVTGDATVLPWGTVKNHADDHPECVAPLRAPVNQGLGRENPFLAYAETLVDPSRFVRLSAMFTAASPPTLGRAAEVERLLDMKNRGDITDQQFAALVDSLARG